MYCINYDFICIAYSHIVIYFILFLYIRNKSYLFTYPYGKSNVYFFLAFDFDDPISWKKLGKRCQGKLYLVWLKKIYRKKINGKLYVFFTTYISKSKLGKSPWNITTQKIFTDLPFSWHFILAFYSDDPIPQKTTLNKPNVLEHSTVLQNYQCWYAFLIFFFTFSPVYKSHHGFQSLNYQTIFTVQ